MNTGQDQQQRPPWSNYNWNHMALPTFGFIFAVPEPPPDLQLPVHHQQITQSIPSTPEVPVDQESRVEDEPPKPEPGQQSQCVLIPYLTLPC